MARASDSGGRKKLLMAGANKAESPYYIGALSMGLKLLRPNVRNFLDTALSRKNDDIQLEELYVSSSSRYTNIALKDSRIRQDFNLIIVSIKKESGKMLFNPDFETLIAPGDTLIVMGRNPDLRRFESVLDNNKNCSK